MRVQERGRWWHRKREPMALYDRGHLFIDSGKECVTKTRTPMTLALRISNSPLKISLKI